MGRLTGGVTLLAATPWLTFCTPEKHREIAGERARVALIGTGSRGQYHLHNLRAIPHAEVVALCDDYEPNLRAAQRLCPGRNVIRITAGCSRTPRLTALSSLRRSTGMGG